MLGDECLPVNKGSPPRVRGKVCDVICGQQSVGITPACAGKSGKKNFPAGLRKDHPRVCGEKDRSRGLRRLLLGSPPRVRGKVHPFVAEVRPFGITPACAGKRL